MTRWPTDKVAKNWPRRAVEETKSGGDEDGRGGGGRTWSRTDAAANETKGN